MTATIKTSCRREARPAAHPHYHAAFTVDSAVPCGVFVSGFGGPRESMLSI